MRQLILILACFFVYGCQNDHSEAKSSTGKYIIPEEAFDFKEEIEIEPPRTAEPIAPPVATKRDKIIKTGSMSFEVTQLETIKTEVDSLMKSVGGYYENELYNSYGSRNSYSLKIRVPNEQFDSFIATLEHGLGVLKSKNINAKDVTEEYVDLKIRLDNNLAYLSQYQIILKKAKSIKEILEVQEKIRRIEEEIESKKGRLKYLQDNVDFSTLDLEISELVSRKLSNKPSFGRRLINAFGHGIRGFLDFLILLIGYWPFVLIPLLLIFYRKFIINRFKKK